MNHKKIETKLDLSDFFKDFRSFYSYVQNIDADNVLDLKLEFINDLKYTDFNIPPKVDFGTKKIEHIKKFGILSIYELSGIISILKFFIYMQNLELKGRVLKFFTDIEIDQNFVTIISYFSSNGMFNSESDSEVALIDSEISNYKKRVKSVISSLLKNRKLDHILVDNQTHIVDGREVLLCKGGFSSIFSGKVVGSSGSGNFYVEPASVSKIYTEIGTLDSKRRDIIFNYEKRFSELYRKHILYIKFIIKSFKLFDEYQARLNFANSRNLNFINRVDSKDISLRKFIHPSLGKDAKPIDIDMCKKVLIVTGVNAGGKTILLKSILSSLYLSKMLIPFNADDSSYVGINYKDIHPILDNTQDVKNDISTFAGRIVEFKDSLVSGNNLLVGIDEIELGTDSNEASTLFNTLILELIKKDTRVVITTHHKELAFLLSQNSDVELCAALYDKHKELPLYEFELGIIGKSYAFETAIRYGIPKNLVNRAKENYSLTKKDLDTIVEDSTNLKLKLAKEYKDILNEKSRIKELELKYIKDSEKLQKKYKALFIELENDYILATDEVKSAIKKNSSDAHRSLNRAHNMKPNFKIEENGNLLNFNEGEVALYKNSECTILKIKGDIAKILFNSLKIEVKVKSLDRVLKSKKKVSSSGVINIEKKSIKPYLDLHGLRYEEASELLEQYLSDAVASGLGSVLINHGIGGGVLLKMANEVLKKSSLVKNFSDATPQEGGIGAKRVYF